MTRPVESLQFKMMLSVLEHLSDGLYSNVAAVLTEAVANAWDADASRVDVSFYDASGKFCENIKDASEVMIKDDGHGMNLQDVKNRFLSVGYRRRREGTRTEKGRPLMGRKGLGKLALFAIADEIHVETLKNGEEPIAISLDVAKLREDAKKGKDISDLTIPVATPENIDTIQPHGTRIMLRNLRKERLSHVRTGTLRRMIARRFSVLSPEEFEVFVNDERITLEDRQALKLVEFLWCFDDCPPLPRGKTTKLRQKILLDGCDDAWPEDWRVKGWIGTAEKPNALKAEGGNLNSLVVHAHGRLAAEDVLPQVQGAQHFFKYVTGEIQADFLDDGEDDVITSDRQRLREDDDRVRALLDFLGKSLRGMEAQWKEWRGEARREDLLNRYPGVRDWLDGLPKGLRPKARKVLNHVAQAAPDDDPAGERELLRAALFGFERLSMRGDPEKLAEVLESGNAEEVLKLLAEHDDLEVALYRDIAIERIKAIDALQKVIDENAKEKVLQKYLFNHLWLLDPAWDHATENKRMEETVKLIADKDEDAKKGRVDIRYRQVSGRNVVVELKRYSVRPDPSDLVKQCRKYIEALKDKTSSEDWIAIVVLGNIKSKERKDAEKMLDSLYPGSRVFTYDYMLHRAETAYQEFMERSKKIDKLERALETARDEEGAVDNA